MNGIHDLGGMDDFGPVCREAMEPVFHADWERRVFATAIALLGAGCFNLDEVRRATEWMPPMDYLQAHYYERWLYSLVTLLEEKGFATAAEIASGRATVRRDAAWPQPLTPAAAAHLMTNPVPVNLELDISPRFCAGDLVVARNVHPLAHTRLPRYVRGRRGRIEENHGIFLLPDTNAHGGPEQPQHVYCVRFAARELWGDDAPAHDTVFVDLFEGYLQPDVAETQRI